MYQKPTRQGALPIATLVHQLKVCILKSPWRYYNITYILVWTLYLVGS